MVRGSASGKRQQGSSASHSRQDNGPVAASKKAPKKKSQGQLDGKTKSADRAAPAPASPSPSSNAKASPVPTSTNGAANNGHAAAHAAAHATTHATHAHPSHAPANGVDLPHVPNGTTSPGHNGMAKLPRLDVADGKPRELLRHRSSLGATSDASATDDMAPLTPSASGNGHASATGIVEPRQIDVNAARNASHRDGGAIDFVVGVLRSLPLPDTLALLFVLIYLPTGFLWPIYVTYACLTFAPTLSTRTGLNLAAELMDWHSTMPSFVVVAAVDAFILLVWLFLWPAAQQLILDLAKPVMASTLGGGTATRSGRSSRVWLCFIITIFHNVYNNYSWRILRATPRVFQYLPPTLRFDASRYAMAEPGRVSGAATSRGAGGAAGGVGAGGGFLSRVTTVLGIHILMQGVIRYIREWYIRRERNTNAAAAAPTTAASLALSSAHGDMDVARPSGISSGPMTETTMADVGAVAPDTDASLSKRRRKQSAYVRLQQPLWAAIGSTKIYLVKEYELTYAASECAGTNLRDVHDLGCAPFGWEPKRIWVSYIGRDEINFDTSPFPHHAEDGNNDNADDDVESKSGRANDSEPSTPSSIVDRTKPFYVRVNMAEWPSTRIAAVGASEAKSKGQNGHGDDISVSMAESERGTRWTGDIYGLRPSSKYVIEFVDSISDRVLHSTTVTTRREATKATSSAAPPPSQERPDSPVTTLKTSIAASEARLNEWKAKGAKMRKEYKTKNEQLKSTVRSLDISLNNAGQDDGRNTKKVQQRQAQISHLSGSVDKLKAEFETMQDSPDGLVERKDQVERQHAKDKKGFDTDYSAFEDRKKDVSADMSGKTNERDKQQTRNQKLSARINKVDAELAAINDANNRGLNEIERRKKAREMWQEKRFHMESDLNRRFNDLQASNSTLEGKLREAESQVNGLAMQVNAVKMRGSGGLVGQGYESIGDGHGQGQHLVQGNGLSNQAMHPHYPPPWMMNQAAPPHHGANMWSPATDAAQLPLHMAPGLGPAPGSGSGLSAGAGPVASSMWPTSTAPAPAPGLSSLSGLSGPSPFSSHHLSYSLSHSHSHSHSHSRVRARSSSMLSDSSSFAQSSNPDDEAPPPPQQVQHQQHQHQHSSSVFRQGSGGLGPIGGGFTGHYNANPSPKGPLARATRKPSVGEVSGRSSGSGGSGSGGSFRDPTSPI